MTFNATCSGPTCDQTHLALVDMSVVWVLLCSFLVMSMQLGFAMLEVGSVREAHRMTVLAKNVMDSSVSCVAFWAYVSITACKLVHADDGLVQYHLMSFHCSFCATAVTICSGAMAERTHMGAYLFYAIVMASFIYPVLADSAWGGPRALLWKEFHGRVIGDHHYHDFAGAGVVHLTGGCAAMLGNTMLGRRILLPKEDEAHKAVGDPRFSQEAYITERERTIRVLEHEAIEQERSLRPAGGWLRRFDDSSRDNTEFKQCGYLQVMGMFMLWVGWYAFNSGSTLAMDTSASILVGPVVWNTTLAAAGGSFGAYVYCLCLKTHLDVQCLVNGTLAGLVSITAGCDVASGSLAMLIGAVAGLIVYPLSSRCWKALRFDDPVDAVSVHACCGLWGLLAVSFCSPDCHRFTVGGMTRPQQLHFCSKGFSFVNQLVAQLWGCLTIILWTSLTSSVIWTICLLSECTRALEVKYLEEAVGMLVRMVPANPTSTQPSELSKEIIEQWKQVVRSSPLARRIAWRHGWNGSKFEAGRPKDLWRLQKDLQEAQGEKAETALEIADKGILPCIAACLHACPLTRNIAVLRLRITPAAEISGLGSASADGGQLFDMFRSVMKLLTEARHDQHYFHSPLRREVQTLSMTVQSQEVLLEALMRSQRRRRTWWRDQRRPLSSLPEQQNDVEQPANAETCGDNVEAGSERLSTTADHSVLAPETGEVFGAPMASPEAVTDALNRILPRSYSHSSDRTVSDRSAGNLTPRSVGTETPSPTVIGRAMRTRPRSLPGQADSALAAQLAGVLQTHQNLLNALQQVAVAASSGSRTPDSAGSATGRSQGFQQALQSLSRQLELQSGPSQVRSVASEDSSRADPLA